jgi:high-affinity Fe2+/Pb2+ permease
MNKQTFTLKAAAGTVVGAAAALVLTVVLSWTFVDATSMARVQRDAAHGVVDTVAAMVR